MQRLKYWWGTRQQWWWPSFVPALVTIDVNESFHGQLHEIGRIHVT